MRLIEVRGPKPGDKALMFDADKIVVIHKKDDGTADIVFVNGHVINFEKTTYEDLKKKLTVEDEDGMSLAGMFSKYAFGGGHDEQI